MKSILYVAALLMIGASIYGFVDYSKTSRHKEFKSMYDENEVRQPVVTNEKQADGIRPDVIVNKATSETKPDQPVKQAVKKKKKKRTVFVESFSRAPLKEKEVVIRDEKELKKTGQ